MTGTGSLEGGIGVLDFGGQYAHLICRRVRGLGAYAKLLPYDTRKSELNRLGVAGLILSGGPASVYAEGAPKPDPKIFDGDIPVLGICYGYQLLVTAQGGEVRRSPRREYGSAELRVRRREGLFGGAPKGKLVCWMSHSDSATKLPKGLGVLASSEGSPFAAVKAKGSAQYGVQFHPEVTQTEGGERILSNFVFRICSAKKGWTMEGFLGESVEGLKGLPGKVLCAVSGGVDSSVTAVLFHRAVGKRLTCVLIETGLLRAGESEMVRRFLGRDLGLKVDFVDAADRFLGALAGLEDPEDKRKAVGKTFADVFEEFASKHGPFEYLAQGTLYPDVVESGRSGGPAAVIKTHHNVGGLPGGLSMKVVEPLKDLYKDEVRELGTLLGLPESAVWRHPFPGPGLSVRVVGEATREKLRVC
ncbi:MAG TPA: glutamine-hydrolyzing GMP synthase, partial [Nitrososphaerales archaeon]|nr:glutamine-hydrolyzing GMP synthase [Nitrososphaerales archaeon]